MEKLNCKQMLYEALKPESMKPEPLQDIYRKQVLNWQEAEAALEELVAESFDDDGWRTHRIPYADGFWVAADILSDSNLLELLTNHGSAVDCLLADALRGRNPLQNLEKIRELLGEHLLEFAEEAIR